MTEYVERHPELADRIGEVFPALATLERFGQVVAPAAATLDDGVTPRRFRDYRILRQIGRGGMGVVYEAIQESLGRHVALKVLNRSGDVLLQRFQREARIAAKLHHTNIVPVYGVGADNGTPYYAMQYIAGQGLNLVLDELRRRRSGSTEQRSEHTTSWRVVDDSTISRRDATPSETVPQPAENALSGSLSGSTRNDYYRRVAELTLQAADTLAYAHA